MSDSGDSVTEKVKALLSSYSGRYASAAELLCDRHPAGRVSYVIVGQDLSVQELSFGDLRRESTRVASSLWSLGLRPGDRIATLMGKSREYLTSVMAIWRLGAVHVPLFTAFGTEAVTFRL